MSIGVPAAQSVPNTHGLDIENTNIETAPGVTLSARQKILAGSVLDLLAGRPSLKKLQLWADDATFADPLTNAHGRKHYEAQWYSLETAFSEIECLYHSVTSAGNPVTMNLKTRYKIKGIGKDQIISSVVQIYTDGIGERIVRVENRWNDILPEGPFSKIWRNLNSVVVPAFVHVPKNEAEDSKPRK